MHKSLPSTTSSSLFSLFLWLFFVWIFCTSLVDGLFDQCSHRIELKAGQKMYINSPYYPANYPVGSSCRYSLRAPPDHELRFKCKIDMNSPPSSTQCTNEVFYFNREGSELLAGSEFFCGSGTIERRSFLNRAVLSYISTPGFRSVRPEESTTPMVPTTSGSTSTGGVPVTTTSSGLSFTSLHQPWSHRPATTTTTTTTFRPKPKPSLSFSSSSPSYSFTSSSPAHSFTPSSPSLSFTSPSSSYAFKPPSPSYAFNPPSSSYAFNQPSPSLAFILDAVTWRNGSSVSTRLDFDSRHPRTLRSGRIIVDKRQGSSVGSGTTARPMAGGGFTNVARPLSFSFAKDDRGGAFSCLVEVVEPPCDCGWSAAVKVAGHSYEAGVNEFPSMAGLKTTRDERIFCGAAIIHHRYLLSAAHCFLTPDTERPELLRVVVGEHDLSTVLESVYTRSYQVEAILRHESFHTTSTSVRNDIALLRTRIPIEWNRSVGPACLPLRSVTGTDGGRKPPTTGQRLDTAGWGTTSFGGPQSTRLLKTTLDVIGTEQCKRAVGALAGGTFCTFTPGSDTCQYDSGGALYAREHRLFAVGIVSYGFACASNQPSVNTRVASFVKWIKRKTPEVKYCIK